MNGTYVKQDPGPVRRKRRTTEEVTARLLDAARDEFQRCGYAGATTAAIAKAAESTEAQLFRMFDSKAALFREAVFRPLDEHLRRFNESHGANGAGDGNRREDAREYIAELKRFLDDQSPLLLAVLTASSYAPDSKASTFTIDSLNAYFARAAAIHAERLGDNPRVDPRLMVRVSFAAVLGNVMFRNMLFPDDIGSSQDVDAAILEFVLDGVGKG